MQAKTANKISRSAVATVLATSSVALGIPAHSNAANPFKDVKQSDYFYSAVMELVNDNVIHGYGDGTFRPNKNVTRGEAAIMLANALHLDVKNAETSRFSDVKKDSIYYKYVAALANTGVISGYPDGTFQPNEPVQRGAMAKMVALGYGFSLATNISHSFKDVSSDYIFNRHIQTLVNLEITKGTSLVTFEPSKAVTRGELAAFISRANKANAGKPTYIVDNIIDNKIYINSVGYTIGSDLKKFIKVSNKSALLGAHIEGTFNGTTLTSITKLTLNATGTENNIYTFDGGGATFNGTLVINGSYLRFQNWTLNGQTIVAETPRKSLAEYNRLSTLKVAGLSVAGIIDFTKPTNPDDGNLNDGNDSGNLNNGSKSPTAKYSAKLSPINKYIDFTNVVVKNLFVEQNRSYITAKTELPQVTIRRDVEFAELNFNMRNLYLEGDESLTLYGTHDIKTVYKNSYYSVYFNTDSEIETLIVDNANGWIDLGDFVQIDRVIIPPNKTPNDIFDDYKNDNDKIGVIEDNTGEEVDRDPIENGVVPDVTKPIVHGLTVEPDSNQVTATLTVSETGNYYYVILPESALAPAVREIVTTGSKGNVNDSHKTPDGRYTTTFIASGLESVTNYTMYVVHVDDAGNFSARQEKDFATKDGTPPQFDTAKTKVSALPGGKRIQFDFKASETGKYYYFVRETQNIDSTITVDDVIAGAQEFGTVTDEMVTNGHTIIIRKDENGNQIKPLTNYVVYSVLVDDSGNKIIQANMFKSPVKTSQLDEEPPYVTGKTEDDKQRLELVESSGGKTQFYMYFSEKLDKETAENIENYSLSGTGIINVPGQAPITPSKVEYSETTDGSRVLITVPSLTGFVHGDTLRVTVSKAVKDLAENEFENVDNAPSGVTPRNFAEYEHKDGFSPDLTIKKVERNDIDLKAKIYYNATKAGTLYYLIASENDEAKILGMKPEDFVAEFGNNPTDAFNTSDGSGKIYLEGNTPASLKPPITAELGDSTFIYDYSQLNPSTFESYKIYMVLKDRSGRLSSIRSETIISDKEPPNISSFSVTSKENEDSTALISLTSENEGGTAYIGYAPKYVLSNGKYVLNPDVYDGIQPKQFGMNSQKTSAENKADFLRYVPNVQDRVMVKGSLNNYEIKNLNPYTEYVFYIAVQDAFGNFTVKTTSSKQMVSELYTDGTKPFVINDHIVKDPFGNFVFTFNETIGRVYADPDKTTLKQVSKITSASKVEDILEIIPEGGSTLAASDFEIVSYTQGADPNSQSKLIIRPKTNVDVINSFKVNLKVPDQEINDNTKNYALENIIDYEYPRDINGSVIKSSKLLADSYPNNANVTNRSTIAEIELSLGIETTWNQSYYYAVVNQAYTIPADGKLSADLVKRIIDSADAQLEVPQSELISYGKGAINGPNDLSTVKTIYAAQYGRNPSTDLNVFYEDSRLFFFTVDRYGNIIWAKNETTGAYYTNIGPRITTP